MTGNLKLLINFVWKFLGTVRFGNDYIAAILGFGDLYWGNILITRVYFVEGLGHNLFSVGQFCDLDLDVAFRRNTCFVRNLKGVELLNGNRATNLYTINLHDMASTSPICLMARATSTKSWLWHQRLSHLNFDTINDLAINDLVTGLPKFKYHKEHLCPSCGGLVLTNNVLIIGIVWIVDYHLAQVTVKQYEVPTGRTFIVPAGRVSLVAACNYISILLTLTGSKILDQQVVSEPDESQNNPEKSQIQNVQQIVTTTVSNNNAKFPYLKKDEYETWAMKMEYWIMNSDHNLWNVVLNGNSKKKLGRDPKGNLIILPPVSAEEQIGYWVSEDEGLHKGYDRFQKILSQLNQLQAKPDNEDCNMKFLRALPSSWSQVAITLKAKGGLDYLNFDDLYNKLKSLEIDIKGGSSYKSNHSTSLSHSAFVSTTGANNKMSYAETSKQSSSYTSASPGSNVSHFNSSNIVEDVLHSFVAESDPQQQIIYEDFDQIGKLDLEELDIKWQMAMLSVRINRFEKKAGRKMKFNNRDAARFDKKKVRCYKCSQLGGFWRGGALKKRAIAIVDSMVNWSDHEESADDNASQVYGMIAGCDDEDEVAGEFALMGVTSQVQTCPFGCHDKNDELQKEFDDLEA
ncbi:ribonuclease H-like domain-containing protein [Tanacetum coccineum]